MFSGYVYVDTNNDGIKDTGEAGISGVTIKLTGTDVDGNVVAFSTTTDSNGLYNFPNLRAGNYNLMELQPTTYGDGKDTVGTTGGLVSNDMISNITLTPGANSTKNNFGEVVQDKVKLSGNVWVDTNGDGVLDSTETSRVSGTTITITDLLGNVIGTTVTDSNGYYQMIVNPGTYIITETQPTGYGSTTPNVLQVVVTTDSANNNFGENMKGSITGVVYVDKDNDGVQDPGENGIPNTTVTLSNGTVVKTNSAGAYVFPNLVAGTYDITETQPNYVDGKDTSPVGVVTNDKISSIPVVLGVDSVGNIFGELGGSISGNVFIDTDKSTVKNGSEANLPNVVLTLKDSSGNVVATTTSDSNGNYKFDGLALGTYTVVETQPDGYASTTPDSVSATVSSTSKDVTGINFGEVQAGKIKGVVWYDVNKNGIKDPTENTGIANATIQVKDSNGNVVATLTTDATGSYEVGGLPFGTYTVSVKEPTGWVNTTVELVSGTVSTVNFVANFGAVKDLAKTGADYTMILIGLGMLALVPLAFKRKLNQ
jgi:hypothetical protein